MDTQAEVFALKDCNQWKKIKINKNSGYTIILAYSWNPKNNNDRFSMPFCDLATLLYYEVLKEDRAKILWFSCDLSADGLRVEKVSEVPFAFKNNIFWEEQNYSIENDAENDAEMKNKIRDKIKSIAYEDYTLLSPFLEDDTNELQFSKNPNSYWEKDNFLFSFKNISNGILNILINIPYYGFKVINSGIFFISGIILLILSPIVKRFER